MKPPESRSGRVAQRLLVQTLALTEAVRSADQDELLSLLQERERTLSELETIGLEEDALEILQQVRSAEEFAADLLRSERGLALDGLLLGQEWRRASAAYRKPTARRHATGRAV